jgi:A/G-specific adenine glycosylase
LADSRDIARALLAHFDAHRRAMPWRETTEPYAIWVSEVMLQQTRVETVRPYYERWMARFPTLHALAAADLDDVLREWQGLGYYSRARNLHQAARLVRERYGGEVPADVPALRTLPGVGEYTAGAIASIAFGVPAPAVDGNVRRVLARLHDLEDPGRAELRALAAGLVPAHRPGDFNQALMELGATICTPRSPDCGRCPVAGWCSARACGTQEERPRPAPRKPVPEETVDTVVLVRAGDEALLIRRPERGLLAGLWEFPADAVPGIADLREASRWVGALDPVVQVFSHRRVTYRPTVHALTAAAGPGVAPDGMGPNRAWVSLSDPGRYALPVAQQKIAASARALWGNPRPPFPPDPDSIGRPRMAS